MPVRPPQINWAIFTNPDPFRPHCVESMSGSPEMAESMPSISPTAPVMRDIEMLCKPRDSLVSSQPVSDSPPLSSAPSHLSPLSSSDTDTSVDSDTLVDSTMVSPQNSDPLQPPAYDSLPTKAKYSPPRIIPLQPSRPLKTPSIKRIISGPRNATPSSNAMAIDRSTSGDETPNTTASCNSRSNLCPMLSTISVNTKNSHFSSRFASFSSSTPDDYIIRTDKPADFPYLVHAYPLKEPSPEEPMAEAIYAEVSRSTIVPVMTIVHEGNGRSYYVRPTMETSERASRVLERYGTWL
ncbi:hypothetical protein EV356DRAFT_519413 [Viridothelium virens]|uniref:Uncharacterized protein n=1 Tax=Viridothelium virens TaxID=1048519 RepID=A0A6A6GYU8_VIRVR|nr:hypothetical protein EV356DRAFT_519413 [Viridothelium virens]